MKLLISDIPDEGLVLDLKEKTGTEDFDLLSPISARLELNKISREIIITGNILADLGLQCSRCLKDFRRKTNIPVNVVYHPIEELGDERHEIADDEMDMGFYRGEELDLQELLKEQVLLNIQMKPLCNENCKGLCPVCGADLNKEKCGCEKKSVDPRLEVLKKLLEKRKE